jgi:hypothetical protein
MNDINKLLKGAGEMSPLKHNGYFERLPHEPTMRGDARSALLGSLPWAVPSREFSHVTIAIPRFFTKGWAIIIASNMKFVEQPSNLEYGMGSRPFG